MTIRDAFIVLVEESRILDKGHKTWLLGCKEKLSDDHIKTLIKLLAIEEQACDERIPQTIRQLDESIMALEKSISEEPS